MLKKLQSSSSVLECPRSQLWIWIDRHSQRQEARIWCSRCLKWRVWLTYLLRLTTEEAYTPDNSSYSWEARCFRMLGKTSKDSNLLGRRWKEASHYLMKFWEKRPEMIYQGHHWEVTHLPIMISLTLPGLHKLHQGLVMQSLTHFRWVKQLQVVLTDT